jgi:hypothetical protein
MDKTLSRQNSEILTKVISAENHIMTIVAQQLGPILELYEFQTTLFELDFSGGSPVREYLGQIYFVNTLAEEMCLTQITSLQDDTYGLSRRLRLGDGQDYQMVLSVFSGKPDEKTANCLSRLVPPLLEKCGNQ